MRNHRLILVAIFLVAAALRLYGIYSLSPPGLEHDEVAHWLINRDIEAGKHAVYFPEAYGHEAGFHYVQTLFMVLMGDNALILRLPSAFAGLILIAISFALIRQLFGTKSALLAAGLLAVLFWPVFYSRLALRAISLPLLSALSAYFWWKGWNSNNEGSGATNQEEFAPDRRSIFSKVRALNSVSPEIWFAMGGLFAGLSLYTYMASRVLPIFYIIFIGYLFLLHKRTFLARWRGILVFVVFYAVVSAPLVIYLVTHSGVESRIDEVNQPLLALVGGELKPVVNNSIKAIAMFGLRGDPLWRQNVAHLPVFDPLVAVFFYIGLVISLWKWREPVYLFTILWLFTSTIPSIVTIDAPSSIRIINALPVVTLFPVIGLEVIHIFGSLSTVSTKLSTDFGVISLLLVCLGIFLYNGARTTNAVFRTWPSDGEVQFVWQQALTHIAGYLDGEVNLDSAAIGGWSPESMDPPTMALSLVRDDLDLRFFDPTNSVIIPQSTGKSITEEATGIFHPTILPIDLELASILVNLVGLPGQFEDFTAYRITRPVQVDPQFSYDTTLGNEITFLGYDLDRQTGSEKDSTLFSLVTYWQIVTTFDEPRRIFLHLVDTEGNIIAQDDLLGAPSSHWSPGDILLQSLSLSGPSEDQGLELRLGIYNPTSGLRLTDRDGVEFVVLVGQA